MLGMSAKQRTVVKRAVELFDAVVCSYGRVPDDGSEVILRGYATANMLREAAAALQDLNTLFLSISEEPQETSPTPKGQYHKQHCKTAEEEEQYSQTTEEDQYTSRAREEVGRW